MAYTETTTTGYGTRLGNSFKGIFTGFLMIIGATVLLWWNEGRAVKTTKMLEEAQGVCEHVDDIKTVSASVDGKLIHANGIVTTQSRLSDATFGIDTVAIKLSRKVEYFQYVEESKTETKDKIGGGEEKVTTYTYKKEWVSSPVESSSFHDPQYQGVNFVLTNAFESESLTAEEAKIGAYKLSAGLISSVAGQEDFAYTCSQEQLNTWSADVMRNAQTVQQPAAQVPATAQDTTVVAANGQAQQAQATQQAAQPAQADTTTVAQGKPDAEYVHLMNNGVYFGKSQSMPQIGDVRVTFTIVNSNKEASVIAKVSGDQLGDYKAENGKTFSTLYMGTKTADEMFESEHASNNMWTWILRIIGVLLVIAGFKGLFGFIVTILKVLPFLANIAEVGVNLVASILGFVWSLIVIALAWIFYRPVLGIILLVLAVGGIYLLAKRSKEKKQAAAAQAQPTQPAEPQAPTDNK